MSLSETSIDSYIMYSTNMYSQTLIDGLLHASVTLTDMPNWARIGDPQSETL